MLSVPIFPKKIWLGSWIKDCKNKKCIIIFDTSNVSYIINYIKYKYPYIRIIMWYWNTVNRSVSVKKINRNYCEIWSYNKQDCNKYNFNYNTQFYFNVNIKIMKSIIWDVYFLGADKNRSRILKKLADYFESKNITYRYILTKYKDSVQTDIMYSEPISYDENLINVQCSKVILDIVNPDQYSGFTLRPFEASMFRRKLITNDVSLKEIKFYSKNNIFILGIDPIESIKSFIESPYDNSIQSELEFYEYDKWIGRFME